MNEARHEPVIPSVPRRYKGKTPREISDYSSSASFMVWYTFTTSSSSSSFSTSFSTDSRPSASSSFTSEGIRTDSPETISKPLSSSHFWMAPNDS